MTETGWRGSREGWIAAAHAALIRGGVEAVKILPLARDLKLARTSFYWHFRDREDLLAALADLWEVRTTAPLIAATETPAETEAGAILNILECFVAGRFDDRMELAVRGQALGDPGVMARIKAADRARLDALTAMLVRWGHAAADADVRARTIYMVQIGYISMQERESLEMRFARVPGYVVTYSGGRAPDAAEMAAFRDRVCAAVESGSEAGEIFPETPAK